MSRFAWLILLCLTNSTWAEGESENNEAAVRPSEDGPKSTVSAVEEILNRDPEISDYVDKERCINRNRIRQMQVLDEKHVSIQVSRDNYYLVQFQHRCPGLRRGQPIMYETRSATLCVHDSLRTMERWGFGRMRPGIRCRIPGFESITKEQLVHLKDALKAEKRKPKKA